MKRKLKLAAILIGLALILAGVISIYLKVTSVNTMLNKKHIKIEDETGTYEIVYAKDLKRIKMTNKKNVLAAVDNDSFYYEFTEADRKVRKLKVGQAFYGVLPGNSGEVIAAVVEDIQVYEDRVIIRGSEPSMADLFDKVDIDAVFPADALVIDELAEDVILEETSLTTASVSDGDTDAERTEMLAEKKWTLWGESKPKRLPKEHTFKRSIMIQEGLISAEASLAMTIEDVTVSVDFAGGESPVYSTVATRTTVEIDGEVMAEGNYEKGVGIGEFHIPTSVPLLTLTYSANLHFSVSGGVGGSFTYRQSSVNGAEITASLDGVSAEEINRVTEKETDFQFAKFEAEMRIGPKYTVGLAFAKKLIKANISAWAGLKAETEYAPFESVDEFTEVIHDCGVCFAGEMSSFTQFAYNVELNLWKKEPVRASAVFAEWSVPIDDFYLSFGPDGKLDVRFGLGECPYRRYRTEIKVYNERGEIHGAEVSASFPDGRFEETYTDEFGYAVLWLPDGENTLFAEYNGYISDNHYTVDGAPGKTEIGLDFDQRIYVICNFYEHQVYRHGDNTETETFERNPEDFAEIFGRLKSHYPNAEFYSSVGNDRLLYDSGVPKFLELFDVNPKPGDIILQVGAGYYVDSWVTEGNEYTSDDYYDSISGKLYLCLNNGLLNMYDGYYYLRWEKDESESIPDEEHPGWSLGFYSYLSEVYFQAEEMVRDYVEYDEQFNHISSGYIYDGLYDGHNTYKEEHTLNDTVYYTVWNDWDHNPTGYLESQVGAWGEALVEFAVKAMTERIDPLLVE